jgi:hypothetical protein
MARVFLYWSPGATPASEAFRKLTFAFGKKQALEPLQNRTQCYSETYKFRIFQEGLNKICNFRLNGSRTLHILASLPSRATCDRTAYAELAKGGDATPSLNLF